MSAASSISPPSCPLAPNPADLLTRFRALRDHIATETDTIWSDWADLDMREAFRPSAQNLATYLAFRHTDLSAVQPDLAALGLST
ncbi:pyruvate kinase, partial [Roseobacter sp. TSBP12]